jgi:hypothetical protein
MAIALNHSRATGTAKVVMLGIANHDGDGGAWPTVATLAGYANVDSRRVQAALKRLEELGEIRRVVQQGGDHSIADSRRPNLYRVLLQCPADCDRTAQHRTSRRRGALPMLDGVMIPSPGDDSVTGRGDDSVTQTSPVNQYSSPIDTSPIARARNKACVNGHEIIGVSAAGVPFCALGCEAQAVSA